MKTGAKLAFFVLSLVSIAHLLRLGVNLSIENWSVPQWVSVVAVIVPGAIALMMWRESR